MTKLSHICHKSGEAKYVFMQAGQSLLCAEVDSFMRLNGTNPGIQVLYS